MARIVDTGISVTGRTSTHVTVLFGVDLLFTPDEVAAGRSGAAKYSCHLLVWDEDLFSNDRVLGATREIVPEAMDSRVGIDFPAEMKLTDLRRKEPDPENNIELFAQFTILKNGQSAAPSVRSRTITIELPEPPPQSSNTGQTISVRTEGAGASAIAIVTGQNFTSGSLVVIRFTDSALNQLRATATADAAGSFEARRSVPCSPGIGFTVTAFEDANPTGSFANAVQLSCP